MFYTSVCSEWKEEIKNTPHANGMQDSVGGEYCWNGREVTCIINSTTIFCVSWRKKKVWNMFQRQQNKNENCSFGILKIWNFVSGEWVRINPLMLVHASITISTLFIYRSNCGALLSWYRTNGNIYCDWHYYWPGERFYSLHSYMRHF